MAEEVSDSDIEAFQQRPKRRRILDPSVIVPVPIYSSKVSSSLQLKPAAAVLSLTEEEDTNDGENESLWSEFSSAAVVTFSDSEEEETRKPKAPCSHSPSPPDSPVIKHSSQFLQRIREIDRNLEAVNSHLTPTSQKTSSSSEVQGSPYGSPVRQIPLKIRCRTDIHKIPVLPSTLLSDVVEKLSVILNVPPRRLLLTRADVELPTDSTVGELGLSIADIIECDVMAAEELRETHSSSSSSSNSITVRLQGKDRASSQEFSLHRDAQLSSVFSQYMANMSATQKRKVRFLFDGSKVTHRQTPAQLDMEDGDIIEVWT